MSVVSSDIFPVAGDEVKMRGYCQRHAAQDQCMVTCRNCKPHLCQSTSTRPDRRCWEGHLITAVQGKQGTPDWKMLEV